MTGPVEPLEVEVDGIPVSGLRARVPGPRATILAVHGGGSSASYFHGAGHPDQSLLALAVRLGFNALAFDQPGYGASAGRVGHLGAQARADLVAGALTGALGPDPWGDGVVLVAHSLGSQVAAELATRMPWVIGLEISGTGLQRHPALEGTVVGGRSRKRTFEAIWGAPHLYPDGALTRERTRGNPSPPFEMEEALTWPRRLPQAVSGIPVPVHLTAAEHEGFWSTTDGALTALAALFARAPSVEIARQPGAPHNISLSLAARAYHLRVLAFAEECRVSRRATVPLSPTLPTVSEPG
jgi:pimeloyl-ACP methyl ester carboxylesterase